LTASRCGSGDGQGGKSRRFGLDEAHGSASELELYRLRHAVDGEITFSTPMGTFHRPYRHVGRYSPFER